MRRHSVSGTSLGFGYVIIHRRQLAAPSPERRNANKSQRRRAPESNHFEDAVCKCTGAPARYCALNLNMPVLRIWLDVESELRQDFRLSRTAMRSLQRLLHREQDHGWVVSLHHQRNKFWRLNAAEVVVNHSRKSRRQPAPTRTCPGIKPAVSSERTTRELRI
ncbi:unnamed protein product [Gadus morhua 'NCC']